MFLIYNWPPGLALIFPASTFVTMPPDRMPSSQPMGAREWVLAAIGCFLTVLWMTPFAPSMPVSGVDGSWAYAMNVAVAGPLQFGSDVVFTFGPLAAVYTGVYHPATDAWMVIGSALIAVALFAGCWVISPGVRRYRLLLVPFVVGLIWSSAWDGWRDALFLFVPLLLPWVVDAGIRRGKPFTGVLCLLAAAMAILPLVKGNLTLMVVLSSVLGVGLGWRASRTTSLLVIAVLALTLLLAWMGLGQRVSELPLYFIAQAPLVSAYTDAMSVPGRGADLVVYLSIGALLLGISLLLGVRSRWYAPLLVAAYLFISFKSGFVRHDEQHAVTAAATLLLVGLLIYLSPGSEAGRGPVALLLGVVGWGLISAAYIPLTGASATARLSELVVSPAQGLWTRISNPARLPAQYRDATASLGGSPPFAGYRGTADVYPWDLTPLIAAGSSWTPRPVIQSYAAITPALAQGNARHLQQSGPARVYFAVNPIDNRYPSMEDGVSWLPLLGMYSPVSLEGGYAVLERGSPAGQALRPGTPVTVQATLGRDVAVSGWERPVWASIDIRPTLAGKLATVLYKSPRLTLKVRYEDGGTAEYRLVASMAKSGFLLSPTVASADDYVALASSHGGDLLGKRRVVALGVSGDSGTRMLWNLDYTIRFSPLDVGESAAATTALLGTPQPGNPPQAYTEGGNCSIDEVDQRRVGGEPIEVSAGLARIRGWAALDGAKGVPNKGAKLLVGSGGQWHAVQVRQVARPDVAAYFNQPALGYAGFEAYLDVAALPPRASVRVLQDGEGTPLLCQAQLVLNRIGASSGTDGPH